MCKVSNKMKRSAYLRHASGWPDCATTQPRGRRLRSRRHVLSTLSPSMAASHPVDLKSQCLRNMPNEQYETRLL